MVEIEIAADNAALHFRPLGRNVRGPFDLSKHSEPLSKLAAAQWPLTIPGQRIGIDREGVGYISEPLHEQAHAPMREKITKSGMKLEDKVQTFPAIDVATWQWWLKRAVESGLCRIVSGSLPEVIEGPVRKNFILAPEAPNAGDKLTAALDRQTAAFEGLTAAIGRLLEK